MNGEEQVSVSILPWVVVLLPLIGFLILAVIGAGATKEPKPVVETAPAHDEHGPEVSPYAMADHDDEEPHGDHGDDHGHGPHVELDKGGKALVGWLATALVAVSFVISCSLFVNLNAMTGDEKRIFSPAFEWMGPAGINFGLVVDPLSALMMLIITGVGTLIHVYSVGYMDHDRGYARYFSYLNLFVFFMLLLVMGSNLVVTFVGWEGVGLASYLLIGFYHLKKSANDAAKKAFIVNRVGDCAFLVGMFALYYCFGTLDLYGKNGLLTTEGLAWAKAHGYEFVTDLVPLLLFLGAAGKSAQIPLYVWLPDAMEGPTPVSALIHAATMVTGGVFLIARTHALFLQSPTAMTVVAVVGLVTALLAATIALTQDDIKKVLAYSTVSQLGFMFLACGVGAFGAAMFHVTTHAFFKALLFLGSGSVIHAMGGEQDMRKMGGLKSKIPVTCWTMFIGVLAISGVPGLAGFFSKDEILLNAFLGAERNGLGHWSLWLVGWLTAGLTAFYMTRMWLKTFWGEPRYSEAVAKKIHESPPIMFIPLLVLAALSVAGGYLNAPIFGLPPYFEKFLHHTVEWREHGAELKYKDLEWLLAGASIAIAVVGIGAAWNHFSKNRPQATEVPNDFRGLVYNKWAVDDVYEAEIVQPGANLSRWLWRVMDVRILDGIVTGAGRMVAGLANGLRGWQSGYVRNYALSMVLGVVLVVAGALFAMAARLK
jgi:NADH-quinone oxidoreductase subunit L